MVRRSDLRSFTCFTAEEDRTTRDFMLIGLLLSVGTAVTYTTEYQARDLQLPHM